MGYINYNKLLMRPDFVYCNKLLILHMYMCIYISTYTYVYTNIRTLIHTYTCTHINPSRKHHFYPKVILLFPKGNRTFYFSPLKTFQTFHFSVKDSSVPTDWWGNGRIYIQSGYQHSESQSLAVWYGWKLIGTAEMLNVKI